MSSGEATMAWVAARSGEGERAEWQLRQPPSQNEAPFFSSSRARTTYLERYGAI